MSAVSETLHDENWMYFFGDMNKSVLPHSIHIEYYGLFFGNSPKVTVSMALWKFGRVDFRVRMFRISWIKFRLALPACWIWVNSFECVKHGFQLICESKTELVISFSVFFFNFYNFHFKFIHFLSTIYLNSIALCDHKHTNATKQLP